MVGPPFVEYPVKGFLVMEVAVSAIDRQSRRGNGHEKRAGAPLNHFVTLAWSNDDDLMTETRSGAQLRVDIGAHAAAGRSVECANVDNSHAVGKPGIARNLK